MQIDIDYSGMTTDQLQNLLIFLGQQQNNNNKVDQTLQEEPTTCTSNLAGKFCVLSKINCSKWIIDSGTTNQMCNNPNCFSLISVPKLC